jgi:hypothetical protein
VRRSPVVRLEKPRIRRSSRLSRAGLAARGRQARGLHAEVVSFRKTCRLVRRSLIVDDGCLVISGHLEEMAPNGIEAVMAGEPFIGIERFQQLESGRWTVPIAAAMA